MIQSQLVEYVKKAKEEGHDLKDVKSVLVQQGWSETDINESILAATMPVAPAKPTTPSSVSRPRIPVREKKIPEYYISPLSMLLGLVLFASLFTLTGRVMADIEEGIAPYAASSVYSTAAHEQLSERYYPAAIPPQELQKLQTVYQARHSADTVTHLFVVGIVSAIFWVLAFVVHYLIGKSHRQFLPLSVPYFLTAGLYLVSALLEIISRLFERQAQVAVYVVLFLFIGIVTPAFIFYQKRSHAEKPL